MALVAGKIAEIEDLEVTAAIEERTPVRTIESISPEPTGSSGSWSTSSVVIVEPA